MCPMRLQNDDKSVSILRTRGVSLLADCAMVGLIIITLYFHYFNETKLLLLLLLLLLSLLLLLFSSY